MKRCFALTAVLLLAGFAGCTRQSQDAVDILIASGSIELGDVRHQKEDFDRSFELLNSLDTTPSLPTSPGFEQIVNTADRLDKWIQTRTPDKDWKPDPELVNLETTVRAVAETAAQIVQLLHLLQGNTVQGTEGQKPPENLSENLSEERKQISDAFTRFISELLTLSQTMDLPSANSFSQLVSNLQKKFAALDQIANIDTARVRVFAKQLESETADFDAVSKILNNYADQLRIDGLSVRTADAEYLKQSVWLRDVSQWARGDKQVLLDRVTNLFDWVVCNVAWQDKTVALNQQQSVELPQQYPWQTILLGYGTVLDRAAVFIELLRQQRIDSALLAVPNPDNAKQPLFWAVGVLIDGEVYVYLLTHGFPLPGEGGAKIGEDGALTFPKVATLSQIIENDSLLRQIDISATQKFPITAEMVKNSSAYLYITPESASMRMKVIESELTGNQTMVLYSDVAELRRRFEAARGITSVQLWKYPFQTVLEQLIRHSVTEQFLSLFLIPSITKQDFPLWSGRVLYFKGNIGGQGSAMTELQDARVSDREMIEYRNNPNLAGIKGLDFQVQLVTANASYWLGLASFENHSIPAAKDFLNTVRVGAVNPWRDNTEYLLGRIAEREKRYADAVKHYERTNRSLSGPGNQIRTKWLPK